MAFRAYLCPHTNMMSPKAQSTYLRTPEEVPEEYLRDGGRRVRGQAFPGNQWRAPEF
jgi:hypothetical protein